MYHDLRINKHHYMYFLLLDLHLELCIIKHNKDFLYNNLKNNLIYIQFYFNHLLPYMDFLLDMILHNNLYFHKYNMCMLNYILNQYLKQDMHSLKDKKQSRYFLIMIHRSNNIISLLKNMNLHNNFLMTKHNINFFLYMFKYISFNQIQNLYNININYRINYLIVVLHIHLYMIKYIYFHHLLILYISINFHIIQRNMVQMNPFYSILHYDNYLHNKILN